MDTFEKLLEAIEAYSDARAEYKKAKEGCQNYYFLDREIERLNSSKDALRHAVAAHVMEVMADKNTF